MLAYADGSPTCPARQPGEATFLPAVMGCGARDRAAGDQQAVDQGRPGLAAHRPDTAHLVLGSEWGEYYWERVPERCRHLLHAARLLRDPERYIALFGKRNYDIKLGDCLWHVYRMIGKLSSRVYLLSAPDDSWVNSGKSLELVQEPPVRWHWTVQRRTLLLNIMYIIGAAAGRARTRVQSQLLM